MWSGAEVADAAAGKGKARPISQNQLDRGKARIKKGKQCPNSEAVKALVISSCITLHNLGYKGRLNLAALGNLQSLVNVAGADCDLNHLAELTNLRKLFIRGGVENMEEMLKSTGITFNHLRSLSVYSPGEVIPMNMGLSCPHTYKLQLSGKIREQSLEGLQGYEDLTKMSLFDTGLQLESLKILENIPNLRMLWLRTGSLENVSEIVVPTEGYPNLEFLSLEYLRELKSWSIEKGGMGSLRRFVY
ncbi:hypothetical protein DVH24_013867 [Malus domestica]|uniref:Uncharacterized protein n=1 Tax=Malus domestica TaxID=3750 RepID=A0A498JJ00_MALDO|nr:hypothetical protein DVH24_013867 [Malus domestica]